jgi:hypothetical protein
MAVDAFVRGERNLHKGRTGYEQLRVPVLSCQFSVARAMLGKVDTG